MVPGHINAYVCRSHQHRIVYDAILASIWLPLKSVLGSEGLLQELELIGPSFPWSTHFLFEVYQFSLLKAILFISHT
jgi:hypothetical protein